MNFDEELKAVMRVDPSPGFRDAIRARTIHTGTPGHLGRSAWWSLAAASVALAAFGVSGLWRTADVATIETPGQLVIAQPTVAVDPQLAPVPAEPVAVKTVARQPNAPRVVETVATEPAFEVITNQKEIFRRLWAAYGDQQLSGESRGPELPAGEPEPLVVAAIEIHPIVVAPIVVSEVVNGDGSVNRSGGGVTPQIRRAGAAGETR